MSTGYPVPPLDLSAPPGLSWTFTVLCVVASIGAVGYGLVLARRGEVMGLVFLGGGLLTAPFETLADYIGLLWFASDNVAITINLTGRHIPLYVVLGYMFFFGLFAYIDYRAISLGMGRKYFLWSFVTAFGIDWALQATGSSFGLYQYYGVDPLRAFGAPLWWFAIDASSTIVFAYVMFALRHRFHGVGRLLPVLAIPAMYAGWNLATGLPVFIAKNSNFDPVRNGNGSSALVLLGGVMTIALVMVFGWILLSEIRRAQLRSGIAIRDSFSFRDLLLAPLPVIPVDEFTEGSASNGRVGLSGAAR